MAIERSKIITELRSDIPSFLVIASISPFIGLLGTVWEIMATFYSLNTYKVVNLSLVIPGIAQSMFSSILAILVAVFSVFFYNFLITKVNNFIEETEVFAHELTNILARELDMLTNNASKRALQERKSAVSDDDDDDDI
jgi:biopolymer transport protein TolQ